MSSLLLGQLLLSWSWVLGAPIPLVPCFAPLSWVFRVFGFPLCPREPPAPSLGCSRASGMGCLSSFAPQPPLAVDDSVQGMLKVLSSLSEKETGTFLDWEGNVLPW